MTHTQIPFSEPVLEASSRRVEKGRIITGVWTCRKRRLTNRQTARVQHRFLGRETDLEAYLAKRYVRDEGSPCEPSTGQNDLSTPSVHPLPTPKGKICDRGNVVRMPLVRAYADSFREVNGRSGLR